MYHHIIEPWAIKIIDITFHSDMSTWTFGKHSGMYDFDTFSTVTMVVHSRCYCAFNGKYDIVNMSSCHL